MWCFWCHKYSEVIQRSSLLLDSAFICNNHVPRCHAADRIVLISATTCGTCSGTVFVLHSRGPGDEPMKSQQQFKLVLHAKRKARGMQNGIAALPHVCASLLSVLGDVAELADGDVEIAANLHHDFMSMITGGIYFALSRRTTSYLSPRE